MYTVHTNNLKYAHLVLTHNPSLEYFQLSLKTADQCLHGCDPLAKSSIVPNIDIL